MILKASQRGGGMALAAHLLKAENEHVEVHEIRGFIADDLKGAMKEAQATARGTRCKQYLFSVSLNPPESAPVEVSKFEAAIERVEKANGLEGQPRMIVFHEKEGRRHAHCVWSRIDAQTMTARQMSHFKLKLREISKGLYLEHGWLLPRGLTDYRERDPANFSLRDWQQAKRLGRDPNLMKAIVRECWAATNSKEAFAQGLKRRGLGLAKGDRRDYVVVAHDGTVRAIPKLIGKRTKEVASRLGDMKGLSSVAEVQGEMAEKITPRLKQLLHVADAAKIREMRPLDEKRQAMRERHSGERQKMVDGQKARSDAENRQRADKFRSGVAGLWDRLTGRHTVLRKENEKGAFTAFRRDRSQRDALVSSQLDERRALQCEIVAVRTRHASRVDDLTRDVSRQRPGVEPGQTPSRSMSSDRSAGRKGPSLGL